MADAVYVGDRKVGEVVGRTFVKHCDKSNYFRIKQGFSITAFVVESLRGRVDEIEIHYHGERGYKLYKIPLSDFIAKGERYHSEGEERIVCRKAHMREIGVE
jgi:hypothetical protein